MAHLAKGSLFAYGTIDGLCETSSVFTNRWRVHEALDARCAVDLERRSGAHVGDESRRFGSTYKPLSANNSRMLDMQFLCGRSCAVVHFLKSL